MPKVNRIHPVEAETLSDAWLEAIRLILGTDRTRIDNLIVSIEHPSALTPGDHAVCNTVDSFLRSKDLLPLITVANTILPGGYYRDGGAKAVYQDFPASYQASKSGWGTYAGRLFAEKVSSPKGDFIRMERIVEKLKKNFKAAVKMRASYEVDVYDSLSTQELSIYQPGYDSKQDIGQPCLTHLSFKLNVREETVSLTALYRSQYYIQKALGNFIGLGQLLAFTAQEAGLGVGHLTCHATQAELDLFAQKGKRRVTWSVKDISDLAEQCTATQEVSRRNSEALLFV
ncbi:thymidylate synthase family protein [Terriglobus albidus]|uniref:hypothetical protein n=1 Tax=Terriglobus albidus TaxID=1592106 RepID=UPI0021E0ED9F|nr:hypothetical protein [Terriglobus albidus]